jgi:hypothetical protein
MCDRLPSSHVGAFLYIIFQMICLRRHIPFNDDGAILAWFNLKWESLGLGSLEAKHKA